MPVPLPLSHITTEVYDSAVSLPRDVWNAFKANPRNSNIIFSHALKEKSNIRQSVKDQAQVWIALTTNDTLDFILSCTNHPMGDYPVFIYSPHPTPDLELQFVIPRIQRLAKALRESIPVERVYSVFAVDIVSKSFADIWSSMTQIEFYKEPYYAAKFTFCTRRSLAVRQYTMMPGLSYDLRLADHSDIPAVARLCYGFAAEAEPFILTVEGAVKEATHLVSLQQLWVHTMQDGDKPSEIASIVAVARESPTVSAITKVYTNPKWRSRKCAERLVRRVTYHLLTAEHKESVVLYVAHNNPAASKVYQRVGFVGLDRPMSPVDGIDSWRELGFDRNKVELGHW